MANIISQRIFDFLKDFPPFSLMTEEELKGISEAITVVYLPAGDTVFAEGAQPQPMFYIIHQGAVGLYRGKEEEALLLDLRDEGDLFGLRSLVQGDSYRMTAKAEEESILYAIPIEVFTSLLESNPAIHKFVEASYSFTLESKDADNRNHAKLELHTDYRDISIGKNPVSCDPEINIKEAALTMSDRKVGSIIVVENDQPVGILTDKDLREYVATGKVSIDSKVSEIMSSPVITAAPDISLAEAEILMMRNRITHIAITENGTPESKLAGVVSQRDLVATRGNNPAVLLKEIKRANSQQDLETVMEKVVRLSRDYINQEAPLEFVNSIISELIDEIIRKAISSSMNEIGEEPPVKFCWMSLGSQGREEQLLQTDQDNALIFENVDPAELEEVRQWFLNLAHTVCEKLDKLGYEYCPAKMMASNAKWCLSLDEWKAQYKDWITRPSEETVMLCTIFFDFKEVYGDAELADELRASILEAIGSYDVFMNYLARNAVLNPPPLGFFRQFLLEADGAHKDQFDLKARALMPLTDAARVLSLGYQNMDSASTLDRYELLKEKEPQNESIYEDCINAFKTLLWFRNSQGFKNEDSGRYIPLNQLSKSERLQLKSAFKPVREIQELLKNRFQLAQIM